MGRRPIFIFSLHIVAPELSAGSFYICAESAPYRCVKSGVAQALLKALYIIAFLIAAFSYFIYGNKIDMAYADLSDDDRQFLLEIYQDDEFINQQ